ncbi:MAG: hypothetical protein CMI16_02965 [Opitutaceae bacterium]|nr:hypothetical protein [Opitutaceae bacterium]
MLTARAIHSPYPRFNSTAPKQKKSPCTRATARRATTAMLAFDIETTGLDPRRCGVTVVCTEDFHTGEQRAYEFARVRWKRARAVELRDACAIDSDEWLGHHCDVEGADDEHTATLDALLAALDAAPSLCAFNGIRFDIPFLQTAFAICPLRVALWVLKTTDILEMSRLVHGSTFKLDLLCEYNGTPMKSGSGLAAIQMAADGRFDALREYCADDVRILNNLYRKQYMRHPRSDAQIDLSRWAPHEVFFAAAQAAGRAERNRAEDAMPLDSAAPA